MEQAAQPALSHCKVYFCIIRHVFPVGTKKTIIFGVEQMKGSLLRALQINGDEHHVDVVQHALLLASHNKEKLASKKQKGRQGQGSNP